MKWGWLTRMVGGGGPEQVWYNAAGVAPVMEQDAPPSGGSMACFTVDDLPQLPADQQFSVWDRLAGDPAAMQMRAYWESKWESFCEPAQWGGPPARADLLPLWQPPAGIDEATRAAWLTRAYRIAIGVETVAHLEPIVDEERLVVGFCARSAELAGLMRDAILKENVGAAVAKAHPGMEQDDACDVILACHPDAEDEDTKHSVVATTKTAHVFMCGASPS